MKTIRNEALDILNLLRYENMIETRLGLYRAIEDTKQAARYENEVVLPNLKQEIKTIGLALQDARARGLGPGDVIYDELVVHVQRANHARAHNRYRIKELAHDQAVQKAALAEINREISIWDGDLEYASTTDHVYALEEVDGPLETLQLY